MNLNRFEKCIRSNVKKLDLSDEVLDNAISLVNELPKLMRVGKSSRTIAAAAIYISALRAGERRIQARLAEAFNTTKTSIRTRYKEIAKEFDLHDSIQRRNKSFKAERMRILDRSS